MMRWILKGCWGQMSERVTTLAHTERYRDLESGEPWRVVGSSHFDAACKSSILLLVALFGISLQINLLSFDPPRYARKASTTGLVVSTDVRTQSSLTYDLTQHW